MFPAARSAHEARLPMRCERRCPAHHQRARRRRMSTIAASAGGAGRKAPAGTYPQCSRSKSRLDVGPPTPRPALHRAAAQAGSTTLPHSRALAGAVRRRSRAVVIANGGFATTLNGRLGQRNSAASARTTTTSSSANRVRRVATRALFNSTAITDARRCRSCAVMRPSPAPMSTTRSPGLMSAAAIRRCIHRLSSRCHPQRPASAATEHHHHRHVASLVRERTTVK